MTVNKSHIKILAYFFPLAILQVTILPYISFNNIAPDLIIILLVYFTIKNGQIFGTISGFYLGLLYDLICGGLLGGYMFSKTFTGFMVGYLYNENKIEDYLDSYWFVLIVLGASMIDSLIYSIIILSDTGINIFALIFTQSILPALYTASISVPFLLFRKRKGLA